MTNFTRLMTPFAKRSLAECMRASGPESRYNPCSQCSSPEQGTRDVAGRNPVCLRARPGGLSYAHAFLMMPTESTGIPSRSISITL